MACLWASFACYLHKDTFSHAMQAYAVDPETTAITIMKPIVHVERNYHSFAGAQYVLPSDDPEKERLALQHRVLKKMFENRIVIPPISFDAADKILDSGTGSGIFLLDLIENKTVPVSVVLQGLDIESRLFPVEDPRIMSRGNVYFTVGTVTKLPEDWENSFALVHQRLLIAALRAHEWVEALSEIYRFSLPEEKHLSLVYTLLGAKGLLRDISVHLPKMLETAGFVDVSVEERKVPLGHLGGQDGVDARNNFMGVYRGMKTPILKAGGLGFVSSEAEFDEMMDAMEKEWDDTPGAEFNFFIIYARKPRVE
ncbi:hypothetical protein A0H81_13343 [Grifola frondosa]|uniref:Methyltransferase domain-containing protein n=1 Tax=Grifola frondosa TaxID=5627 RepID=A0A1C7LSR3_GRIFR|nr:hypothetical protein A0H81_13343 [Grifola frondosa]